LLIPTFSGFKTVLAAAILVATAFIPEASYAQARTERVHFAKGSSSASIKGQIKGDAMVDYQVRAAAGQTITVTLKESNPQNYFNVLPPGSAGVAMFVGQDGSDYEGILPTDGDYTVRVYLMRPAARRNETSNYTLTIGVTGKPLIPVAASKDALIRGTPFHASTQVECTPAFDAKPQQCEAFVIRRGFDGTATVEVRGPRSSLRRILFSAGAPVASDAMETMAHSREGEITVVRFGADERYAIPDALLRGG
jgi:hypothetical protein